MRRSFDFEIALKSGNVHTFSSIEKGEYDKLFNYISSKKLHVKNTGKNVSIQLNMILNRLLNRLLNRCKRGCDILA